MEFQFRAFISYSHQDERWARWLQHALESYKVPRRLSQELKEAGHSARVSPVFRDREDLSAAASLDDRIKDSLEKSECLIVICSPASARSHWVEQEIRYFQSLGRAQKIFCLIVDSESTAVASFRG